jgi:hypothetical protein
VGYSLACSKVLGRTSVLARKRAHSNGFFSWGHNYKPKYHGTDLDFFWITLLPGISILEEEGVCALSWVTLLIIYFHSTRGTWHRRDRSPISAEAQEPDLRLNTISP